MGILETGSMDDRKQPKHFRWFLFGGVVGLALAIMLTVLMRGAFPTELTVKLWPTSIVLMTDSPAILGLLLGYGGNFVLYGLVALLFSLAIGFVKDLTATK
jgi:hypothetical protein